MSWDRQPFFGPARRDAIPEGVADGLTPQQQDALLSQLRPLEDEDRPRQRLIRLAREWQQAWWWGENGREARQQVIARWKPIAEHLNAAHELIHRASAAESLAYAEASSWALAPNMPGSFMRLVRVANELANPPSVGERFPHRVLAGLADLYKASGKEPDSGEHNGFFAFVLAFVEAMGVAVDDEDEGEGIRRETLQRYVRDALKGWRQQTAP